MGGNCGFGVLALLLFNIGWRNTTNWSPASVLDQCGAPLAQKYINEKHTQDHTHATPCCFSALSVSVLANTYIM